MKSILVRHDDGTLQLTITIPADVVAKAREEVIAEAVANAELPGFRKGKAPRKLVEEKLDREKVREDVLKKLLPQAYIDAVKEHSLRPIMNPRMHIKKLEEGQDWEFEATTCEMPVVDLKTYKDAVQKVTAKQKIIIPGKEPEAVKFDDIVKALLENVNVTIPQILIANEADRLLATMLDEIKSLGLTLDQYLASTNRSAQTLRKEYETKAQADLKIEFILQKIAEVEKITVEEKELTEAIQKAKDEKERKNLESNKYLLASILRQQKTLDFLRNL